MKIIFATGNEHKMVEVRAILSDFDGEILSMKGAGIEADIVEDGKTFEENALIKARAIAGLTQDAIVLADDSGLEVDCLNKEPGIYSARYAGEDTPYTIKNQMILDRVKGAKGAERSARFVCAMAAVVPMKDGTTKEFVVRGTFEGYIAEEAAGVNGFGYDPIFWVPECNCTSAELTPEEKNARSHRGDALRKMREIFCKEGIL
ncbi:MAG: RdgB/HAM1 family non-canonical purine NTP pyrophosphatase [Lachnospiraceae bacterium]|jgi:XTP/dITP diphosphohydrolase|nr:RdgB/HAM1 family non-canonical purine NTP pyrophosphatase [Lachnospiraceae bacterium]